MDKFRKPHGHVRPGGLSASSFNTRSSGGDRGQGFRSPGFSRPSFGSRPEQRGGFNKEKFDAICSHCGKPCQVPFRPNGTRPVFCSACFNSPRGDSPISRDRAPSTFSPRPNVRPSDERGNAEFSKPNVPPTEDRKIDDIKRKLDSMDSKLDSIVRAMTVKTEETTKSVEVVKSVEPKKKATARKK